MSNTESVSVPASDLGTRVRSAIGRRTVLVVFESSSTMGLFSKIFGGTTEEGASSSSVEAATPEHVHAGEQDEAASKAAAPDATSVAAAQPPPAKPLSSRKEAERSPDAGGSAPATRRGIARTDGLFAPSDVEPRVVVGTVPAQPAPATTRSAAADVTPSRLVASRPIEVHAPPIKIAAPTPNAAKPGPTVGTSSAKTATRRESSRPAARAARATPPKPTAAAKASKAKTVTLDLDSLPPPAMDLPAAPREPMESQDDVDRAFDLVEAKGTGPRAAPGTHVVDPVTREHNANLFREMAVGFARPVRDFMLDLVLGPTTRQWLDIAKAPVQNLLKGAGEFELTDLAAALVDFDRGLEDARIALGASIAGAERERLLTLYEALARALPVAFDLKGERSRREPMVVHHLLLQVQGVHKLAIDKLYAAGLASLEGLGRSSAEDLMAHARLDREGAERIVRRFRSYLRERTEQLLERGEAQVKQRLVSLIDALGRAHQDFLRADADEDRAAKRRARAERRARALEMNVLLAQLGEIDLIADLERSATDRRIERMRSYVASSGRAPQTRQEAV